MGKKTDRQLTNNTMTDRQTEKLMNRQTKIQTVLVDSAGLRKVGSVIFETKDFF